MKLVICPIVSPVGLKDESFVHVLNSGHFSITVAGYLAQIILIQYPRLGYVSP